MSTSTPAEENAFRIRIEQLEKKIELMRKLSTTTGFYLHYFSELKNHKSNKQCFDGVNELYHSLFGEYRYSDFNSFKVTSNYYSKKTNR
ncbi:hypothetical protein [Flavobacterium aquiphilum]|uniref:hypothetical protein n=1 Tax=Flavobacterium aquiphilum TaxID=3003261 RepID=UPI0024810A22|nr:hypothetical protein [Flavobacterium aquiphilum]